MNMKTLEDVFIHLLSDTYSAVKLLADTLEEEKETDLKLTNLAVGNINKSAEKR
ncbi:hypothetical protein JYK13_14560 [Citrobacter sp. ku-bf4]|uniref:hypothetical protein n=1 Tax=Citrobacter sp. ku-bf4 TaxID=2814654 RepID=UPI00197D3A7E|nr:MULTISPECIES: hypothetical protein [Citrobacter]MBN6045193.1 hypothetical protein [Citrobacter sp. ku-bf4]MBS0826569.1 hypothetical protein [Citrobacter amalonaticus]